MKTLTGAAALAALGVVLTVGTPQHARAQSPAAQPAQPAAQPAAPKAKAVKDTGEYDIYNEVLKDTAPASPNYQKGITDLNTWTQKYPDSDFKDDRLYYYLQCYASTNPPQGDKALDYTQQLMARDLKAIFKDQLQILRIYTWGAMAATTLPSATEQQLALSQKSAIALQAEIAAAVKPAGVSDADWAGAMKQLSDVAKGALQNIAMYPGNLDIKNKDYAKAEQDFTKAVRAYPDNGLIAYTLGSAIMNEKSPDKYSLALYEVARGAAMDPAKGGIADAAVRTQVDAYLKKVYSTVHGSDEGLDQLKQQALLAPLPPPDFKIKTGAEIATEKQKAKAEKFPEFATFMGIKAMLTGDDADKNFADMKEMQVTGLKGVIKSGAPPCRSKEIVVTISDPEDASAPSDSITLKLDKPLTGAPVAGTEIKFNAQPTAFTKDPFTFSMNINDQTTDIQGMKTDPCTPPKAPPKTPAKTPGGTVKKAPPKP